MSGEVWTDYNFSDPGVTIIEQLCYALTELPYRADLPVADLLTPPHGTRPRLRQHGLFPAWSILPCNPVTSADLRRLVIDRVPGVANVWFIPRSSEVEHSVCGLYDVAILPMHEDTGHHKEETALIKKVHRCYTAHRALCEDLASVHVLRPFEVRVIAKIELEENADPSKTLAQAYFALGLMLAPEPRRMTLAQKQAHDPASSNVFSGPLMLRGFIADDQLGEMVTSFTLEQLTQTLAEVPGVLLVDTLRVEVISGGKFSKASDNKIVVPSGYVPRLLTAAQEDGFSITMLRRDAFCEPDAGQVRRRLAALWRQQRETYPLHREYREAYGPPESQHWDLASYLSVQSQFPSVYGVGGALPANPSPMRRAQVKQLQGYLMPFDQMLADSFSQLAFIRELFSIQAGGHSTYAWQSLRQIVPGAEHLLSGDYETKLAELTAEIDPVNARQSAILALLLAFQGLSIEADVQSIDEPRAIEHQRKALLKARQALLRRAGTATRDRGRGFDYLRRGSERAMAGVELLSRIKLGLLDAEAEDFAAAPLARDQSGRSARTGYPQALPPELWQAVDRHFRTSAPEDVTSNTSVPEPSLSAPPLPLDEDRLTDLMRGGLGEPERFRIVELGDQKGECLVFGDRQGRWWLLGVFTGEGLAIAALRGAVLAARQYLERQYPHKLYLVEWILLRHALPSDEAKGQFDFRMTAVLSTTAEERDSAGWRTRATSILRDGTPAHVALNCVFLDKESMHHFRGLYHAWTHALRHGDNHAKAETSRHLKRFLQRHSAAESGDGPQDPPSEPGPNSGPLPSFDGAGAAPAGATPEAPPQPLAPRDSMLPPNAPEQIAPFEPAPDASAPGKQASDGAGYVNTAFNDAALVEPNTAPPAPEMMPPSNPTAPITTTDPGPWRFLLKLLLRGRRPASGALASAPADRATAQPSASTGGQAPSPAHADGQQASTQPLPAYPAFPQPGSAAGTLQTLVPGAMGFDCDSVLTANTAASFKANGFSFAIRYLSRTAPGHGGDLSANEAKAILSAGLGLMAVQHVAPAGWIPSESLGTQYGEAAAANAEAAGLPTGICLWLDLEGVASSVPASATTSYCQAWFKAVSQAGYLPGLYVGANCGLNGQQLGRLNCAFYWRSGSLVPDLKGAAYCMAQKISVDYLIAEVPYDLNVVAAGTGLVMPVMAASMGRS
ncbi:MAG: glycoside hydrolase domain-containing protein [Acetobacteraceae bacterium]|jgi:hypothetical protein